MVKRERIANNVYSFQSEIYAQVNAGAVIGPEWACVIDTLPYPEETWAIRDFIEQDLKVPVRYVILTHYHADHSWGTCFFPGALVISSRLTRQFLREKGMPSFDAVKKENESFQRSFIVLPHLTFSEGNVKLVVGKKTLTMMNLPGHSKDGIGILVEEDRVLFSGDIFMPIPYIVDGDIDEMITNLKKIGRMKLENIVQGHGEVVLRGEVEGSVKDHLAYLSMIKKKVHQASRRKYPGEFLEGINVESCGKSRVLLGGLAEELHKRNLIALYRRTYDKAPKYPPDEKDAYY
ncbi:MAG TPA: MBL fold metallo-hydrolase [Anaerolineae bacterium]|nr:MBL fold metallo-hydrolase [Anaerolineae bacterium]